LENFITILKLTELKKKLNEYTFIYIKYRIGYKNQFFAKFSFINSSILEHAWNESKKIILSNSQINTNEIIEDSKLNTKSHFEQNKIAVKRAKNYEVFDQDYIFNFLKSNYNKTTIEEDNIERRFRNILANKYLAELFSEIKILHDKKVNQINKIIKPIKLTFNFIKINKLKFATIFILMFYFSNNIIDAFTQPDVLVVKYIKNKYPLYNSINIDQILLANSIHEESRFKFNGAICNDGSKSHSQGRGTCSWHGGVYYYFYIGEYEKDFDECKIEANNIIAIYRDMALKRSLID
jgi:hypothetical protein